MHVNRQMGRKKKTEICAIIKLIISIICKHVILKMVIFDEPVSSGFLYIPFHIYPYQ